MAEEDDRLLNLIGIGLVVALVAVIVVGVVIAMNVPANRVEPPDAEWSIRQANETHVRITHTAGESVDGAALVVTVDGYSRHPPWSREVSTGEAVAVKASRSQVVRLYWDGGRADRIQLASRYGAGTRTSTETGTAPSAMTGGRVGRVRQGFTRAAAGFLQQLADWTR